MFSKAVFFEELLSHSKYYFAVSKRYHFFCEAISIYLAVVCNGHAQLFYLKNGIVIRWLKPAFRTFSVYVIHD